MTIEKVKQEGGFFFPPGGILIWMVIIVEIITFAAGLTAFSVQRRSNIELFQKSAQMLNQGFALANTIILITGGYFMAMAISRLRQDDNRASSAWTLAAVFTGIAFLMLKGFEYYQKLEHGIGLEYNQFFNFYWLLTGFHYLHVLLGTMILLVMYFKIKKRIYNKNNLLDVETSAAFWHMCDLIWLLLFAVLYLIK